MVHNNQSEAALPKEKWNWIGKEACFKEICNAYVELLSDYFGKLDSEATVWANADYPKNTNYPESLVHPTVGGLMVRSKSESMIAIALSEHEIPFRYENLIRLCAMQKIKSI